MIKKVLEIIRNQNPKTKSHKTKCCRFLSAIFKYKYFKINISGSDWIELGEIACIQNS